MTEFKELNSKLDRMVHNMREVNCQLEKSNRAAKARFDEGYEEEIKTDAQRVIDSLKADDDKTIKLLKTINRVFNITMFLNAVAWLGFGLYLLLTNL